MLKDASVATRIPAQDLGRAMEFYADKLGLEPVEERDGGLRYVCGAGEFALFEATVRKLRSRGVTFEEYDLPGLKTVNGIADIEGNYPSKGAGERGAWFRDSEGNVLGLGQPLRHDGSAAS
jgi:catechol 2,3-dioxygenase-like lactoylglutathione lyase family enzyme